MFGNIENSDQLTMLLMQIEQLQYEIDQEIASHKKANKRASDSERRNKKLKEIIAEMESDLAAAAYCWNCPNLGNSEKRDKCANNSVFIWNGDAYEWKGLSKSEGR